MAGSYLAFLLIVFFVGCIFYNPISAQLPGHTGPRNTDTNIPECQEINPLKFVRILKNGNIGKGTLLHILENRKCYCDELWEQTEDGRWNSLCPGICFPQYKPLPNLVGGDKDQMKDPGVAYYDPRSTCTEKEKGKDYFVVRACPEDYVNSTTRMLCEEKLPIEKMTAGTFGMVTDETDGITYFNRYCAECNKAKQLRRWRVELKCETTVFVIDALNDDDLVKLVADERSTCRLLQSPQYNARLVQQCSPRFNSEHIISSCNVTGSETSLRGVEDECINSPSIQSNLILNTIYLFKNKYCLICNSKLLQPGECGVFDDTGFDPAFTFLFGFNRKDVAVDADEHKYNKSRCNQNQWMDPQGCCIELLCTKGKILKKDGSCETALKQITGLAYRMGVLLISQSHQPIGSDHSMKNASIEEVTKHIIEQVGRLLFGYSPKVDLQVGVILHKQSSNFTDLNDESIVQQSLMLPSFVWINIFVIMDISIQRDSAELGFVSLFNKSQIVIETKESYSTSYKVQFVDETSYEFHNSCNQFPDTNQCRKLEAYVKSSFLKPRYRHRPQPLSIKNASKSDFIQAGNYLLCPHIQLSNENVRETIDPYPIPHVIKVELRFGDFVLELTQPMEINQIFRAKDNAFYVCLNLIENGEFDQIPFDEMTTLFKFIQWLMTVLCVSVSMICLLATVTTYVIFPSLRCVAGCNTVGLSSSLMVAQLFLFIAGSIQAPSTLCTAVGILTHYSWLVMFTWTFLCCVHVFKVFTSNQAVSRDNPRKQNKAKIRNLVISLSVPALIVVVIIVTNMAVYNKSRIGYGYKTCAMDNPFAIHGPLIFVIVCNTVFFTIVVWKIWSVRRLQQGMNIRKEDRKDFVVYIKLSTLTGMFWLLVILGEAFYNDVIRCIAIVANGCQGIFIFVSFVANRRVLGFYAQKFNIRRFLPAATTTSGSSSTIRTTDQT